VASKIRALYSMPTPNIKKHNLTEQSLIFNADTSKLFNLNQSKFTKKDIILNNQASILFDEIIDNFVNREILIKQKIDTGNKVLLYGKPGTGKTLFANAIAGTLDIPILYVNLDSLISSLLGETGKNIKEVFEFASSTPCVLFLDEFDAIAKQRDDNQELGELKRVVTVLLQKLDQLNTNSLLIAATNHEHLLDKAIWRRFDYQIKLDILDLEYRRQLWEFYLKDKTNLNCDLYAKLSASFSGALIKQIVDNAKRKLVLTKLTDKHFSKLIIQQILNTASSEYDIKTDDPKREILKNMVITLREMDPKLYTFKYIEELSGIPDATLNYLVKK